MFLSFVSAGETPDSSNLDYRLNTIIRKNESFDDIKSPDSRIVGIGAPVYSGVSEDMLMKNAEKGFTPIELLIVVAMLILRISPIH